MKGGEGVAVDCLPWYFLWKNAYLFSFS